MSAPTAEPARAAGASTIVGIAFVLMAISALVVYLIASRGGPIDGAAQLESAFGVRAIGPDYAIVVQRELAGGARQVALEDTSAPPEPARAGDTERATPAADAPEPAEATPGGDGRDEAGDDEERVDWSRVPIPSTQTRPRRITFLFPDAERSHAVVDEFFRKIERGSLLDLGPEGGKVTIASGKLGWRGFDADWVHERVFEKGGTFRDGMRVDLSVEELPAVMTAEWTRGEPASRAALDEILAALSPK